MNNTIQTNQCFLKFKEILTARRVISQQVRPSPALLLDASPVLLRQPQAAVQCYYVSHGQWSGVITYDKKY